MLVDMYALTYAERGCQHTHLNLWLLQYRGTTGSSELNDHCMRIVQLD